MFFIQHTAKELFRLLTLATIVSYLAFSASAQAAIKTEEITYKGDGIEMKGLIAYDDAIKKPRPGVLVVHEWWGHNDYARKRAVMLAELGYTALAVDMYGDGKTAAHPEDAGKFSSAVMSNLDSAKKRFEAALTTLKKHPTTDPEKMAAIGYCFGGGVVLNMARLGVDLDAIASFHGSLASAVKAKPGVIKASLLVSNGADDPFVKPEDIKAFKAEMDAANVDYVFINHPGAMHSFTNPDADEKGKKFGLPLAYNKKADTESWQAMQKLFKKAFK